MADIGIKLSEKTDDPRDIEEMIDKINEVIEEYGFRVSTYSDWGKFRKLCVKETQFYEENKEKWGVDLNE